MTDYREILRLLSLEHSQRSAGTGIRVGFKNRRRKVCGLIIYLDG